MWRFELWFLRLKLSLDRRYLEPWKLKLQKLLESADLVFLLYSHLVYAHIQTNKCIEQKCMDMWFEVHAISVFIIATVLDMSR